MKHEILTGLGPGSVLWEAVLLQLPPASPPECVPCNIQEPMSTSHTSTSERLCHPTMGDSGEHIGPIWMYLALNILRIPKTGVPQSFEEGPELQRPHPGPNCCGRLCGEKEEAGWEQGCQISKKYNFF